jgi:undecaprenyl diphosphate synthase
MPDHIAIIMDGNGRWAKSKMLPRSIGHKNGVKSVQKISEICSEIKIKYLTLYTLSLENFERPKSELNSLMSLLSLTIKSEISKMKDNNIKFGVIGFRDKLSDKINDELDIAIIETKNNTGLNLNLALAYGSRSEIVNMVKLISAKILDKKLTVNNIDEETVSQFLLTKNIPEPDLLIRTGGDSRLSNFLLWQSAYSELYFSSKYWPDFGKQDLYEALYSYQNRERRFGKVKI